MLPTPLVPRRVPEEQVPHLTGSSEDSPCTNAGPGEGRDTMSS